MNSIQKREEQKSEDEIDQLKIEVGERKQQSGPSFSRAAGSICIKNSAYIDVSDMDDQQYQDDIIKRRVSSQKKQFLMIDQFIKDSEAIQDESDD